jgi:glycosyltransferase involved in cell wall biosynthesis
MVTAAWVTPFPPDRNGGGGQIRQAHLLLALARQATVELICSGPVRDPAVRAAVDRLTEVEPPRGWRDDHRWVRRGADLLAVAGSRAPIDVRALEPVRQALAPAVRQVVADVVLVEFAGLAPLVAGRRAGRWVLTFHNLPSRMAAQQAAIMPKRRQRWLLGRDAALASRFEQRAAAGFDAVITCTGADAGALASTGHVLVVPNGVDLDRFHPTPLPAHPRIVFSGALYTSPNVDGAIWFCRRLLPLVREQVPDVEVDIVGFNPVEEVRALDALPGVAVHADVADVAPFLESARVSVAPLRIGSGSRLKVLEAMAAGRPVVGTTIGLEGLDLEPGRQVLVADDAIAFSTAVRRLLADDALATSMASEARVVVEERFGWSGISSAFADSILSIGGGGRRPGARLPHDRRAP